MDSKLKDYFDKSALHAAIMCSFDAEGKHEWKSFGPQVWDEDGALTADHLFRLFSMTKAITSVAVMQLVEQGKIELDASLNELMPEMAAIPILNENDELVDCDKPITMRQLLTHTSGFVYDFASIRLAKFVKYKMDDFPHTEPPRTFEPGAEWCYGTSTMWAGRVVEKISGKTLQEYFEDHIFTQLKMDSTWFNVPEDEKHRIVSWGILDQNDKIIERRKEK